MALSTMRKNCWPMSGGWWSGPNGSKPIATRVPNPTNHWSRTLTPPVAVLVFVGLAGLPSGCAAPESGDGGARYDATSDLTATFVGRAVCASCHADETELWKDSHHDLSMQPAGAETILGDFSDVTLTQFGITSTFFKRNGQFIVHTEGPNGILRDYPVVYTFGVDPLQQYLVEFPGGRLQALSLAWDSRPADIGGQRWFHLYPDERIIPDDPLHWTSPNQNWNYMCAECHSTSVDKNFRLAENRYETTWAEIDVSCESCHGPASTHVSWAQALAEGELRTDIPSSGLTLSLKDEPPAAWVFDLETGLAARTPPRDSRLEIETCARCHSRRSSLTDEYVYGRPLMDSHRPALLDSPLYHSDGQLLDEVYVYGSFLQSKMFAAGVTCSDCHDPHSLEVRGTGNAICAGCHLPAKFDVPNHHFHKVDSPGARCVECHMPATQYMVVDPRRDHSIRIPRPDLSIALATPNACNICHTDQSNQWSTDAVEGWYGPDRSSAPHFGTAIHAGRQGLPGANEALRRLADDPVIPPIVRATALSLLERNFTPEALFVARRALTDADPLVRAAAVSTLELVQPEARSELAVPLLTDPVRAVRLEAARVLASVPFDQLSDGQRVTLTRTLGEYRVSQLTNAERAEPHLNLGVLDVQLGRYDDAERAYRTALRIDTGFVAAHLNLADLYRQQGREAEGEKVLRDALTVTEESAHVEHSLGLLLIRQGRLPEALRVLRSAAERRHDLVRYAYVYGVALQSTGNALGALEVLLTAHERHPEDRDLLIALITMHRDAGSREVALEFARKFAEISPRDAVARQLLDDLEGGAR
ncbi:MAG TPA: tetratricopeptide repeat protein [Acidobacteria bacterium]|nr:tetratricopeptide repeat protein [Acidobacteriota bacterium]